MNATKDELELGKMTWGEFTRRVKEAGVEDDMLIDFIDFDPPGTTIDIAIAPDRTSFLISTALALSWAGYQDEQEEQENANN